MQALSSASGHHNHEKITGCLRGTSPRLQVCLLTHAKSPLLSPGAGGERRWNALSKPQTSHRPPCRVEHVWSHDGTAGCLRPHLVNTHERKSRYGALVPCQGAAVRTRNRPMEKAKVLLHPGSRASGWGPESEEALPALLGPLMDGSAGTFH